MMRIAGLVTNGSGLRYGDWRHVATGCNTLVILKSKDNDHLSSNMTKKTSSLVSWN